MASGLHFPEVSNVLSVIPYFLLWRPVMSVIDTAVETQEPSDRDSDLDSMTPREQLIGTVLLLLVVLAAVALQSL